MSNIRTSFLGACLILLFTAAVAGGTTPADAMRQMKERLPRIDEMKEVGKVGENAAGYLSPRRQLNADEAQVVDAENDDRLIVYMAVAQKTGQSVEAVGANRAVRIAELAREGVWLQLPNGDWYRKE